MKNELMKIGPITIHGYGLMIAIGIIAAYLVAEYRAKKKNLNHELIIDLTIWCLIGGMFGAKILFYITQIKEIINDPKIILNVSDGFVVYGGIVGGILAGYFFCKRKRINFLRYFDLVIPSVALAQGFGRIGCLFAGCCYGMETSSSFGIISHETHLLTSGVRLFPIQIVSSGLNFLHFFVLILFAKRNREDGQIGALYLMFYSAGRFIIEFFRGDLLRGSVGNLSTSQFISIFMFVLGVSLFFLNRYRTRNRAEKHV